MNISSSQLSFFPRKAQIHMPAPRITADSLGAVEADDSQKYYIKSDTNGTHVRASEWICTNIGEIIGISAPQTACIEMFDGSIVFGSRSIGNVSDEIITRNFLGTSSLQNSNPPIQGLSRILSGIYAFDLFINNVDRHFGNYLSTEEAGRLRLYAFDYSRALFWQWPLNTLPASHENTRKLALLIKNLHGFDFLAANAVLDSLGKLDTFSVKGIVNGMPPDWLPDSLRNEFISWWSSSERANRINQIRVGLGNGQLI